MSNSLLESWCPKQEKFSEYLLNESWVKRAVAGMWSILTDHFHKMIPVMSTVILHSPPTLLDPIDRQYNPVIKTSL